MKVPKAKEIETKIDLDLFFKILVVKLEPKMNEPNVSLFISNNKVTVKVAIKFATFNMK